MQETASLSLEKRRAVLDQHIQQYVKRGFRVLSRTDTTAQLLRPKRFSFLWAFLWLLVFGIGLIVYLLYYISKKDETIYLEVTEQGHIRRTR